jgi:hypothetical protein
LIEPEDHAGRDDEEDLERSHRQGDIATRL